MKNQPLISIIMPVYNTEKYVDEAIQSVMQQDFHNFELLLINDGSSDGSGVILEQWAVQDERVHLFFQENQGLSATRNKGLSYAKGKYVYFMDSDDKLRPDTLSSCIDYCESSNLDFVYFDATVFGEEADAKLLAGFNYARTYTVPYDVSTGPVAVAGQLERREFFSSACMVLIKKELLDQHGLKFEVGLLHEDELFTMLLYLQAARVAYLPEKFFLRRVRPDSIMTSSLKLFNIQCYFKIADYLSDFAHRQHQHKNTVDLYLKNMLNAAVWKAHVLPFADRCKILYTVLENWRGYVQIRSLQVLMFKNYFSEK